MIIEKEDMIDVLTEVLKMEKGVEEFYEFALERVYTEQVREGFEKLRDWEQNHIKYLCYLYQALRDGKETLSYKEFMERADSEEPDTGTLSVKAEELFEEKDFIDDTEAIMLALELEVKTFDLYRRLSEKAKYSNAKAIFEEMKHEEERHIDSLRRLKMMVEG
jgi:rubrerythrin